MNGSTPTRTRSITDVVVEVPFALVPAEAALDTRLTQMHLRVLIAILTFRRKNTDSVCVGRDKIARRCGYKEQTISKVTSDLVALGWLEKKGKGGFSRAVEYRVTVPDVGTVEDDETVPEVGTVPGSGTVPDADPTTVPGSGEQRFPDRPHAYNRDLTESSTEVSNAREGRGAAFGPISSGWMPNSDCVRMLEQRGLTKSFVEDTVPEFILYWRERGASYDRGTWQQKFLNHGIHQWERYRAMVNNPNSTPRPIDPNFWPSEDTVRELNTAGMGQEQLNAAVASFRRYWIERREARYAWNSKFHEWALTVVARTGDTRTVADKYFDRSWAEEDAQP